MISLHSLVPHCPGETPLWTDPKWSDRMAKLTLCDKGIFTFPMSWMGDLTESMQGKLHCPKCHAKLGSFSWHKGLLLQYFVYFCVVALRPFHTTGKCTTGRHCYQLSVVWVAITSLDDVIDEETTGKPLKYPCPLLRH